MQIHALTHSLSDGQALSTTRFRRAGLLATADTCAYNCRKTTSANNAARQTPVRISNPMYNADYRMMTDSQRQQQQHQRCDSTEGK